MSRGELNSAELSSWLRKQQNAGCKVIVIEMDLDDHRSGKHGNTNPTMLADAIFRREGNTFTRLRDRLPRLPEKRERIRSNEQD